MDNVASTFKLALRKDLLSVYHYKEEKPFRRYRRHTNPFLSCTPCQPPQSMHKKIFFRKMLLTVFDGLFISLGVVNV